MQLVLKSLKFAVPSISKASQGSKQLFTQSISTYQAIASNISPNLVQLMTYFMNLQTHNAFKEPLRIPMPNKLQLPLKPFKPLYLNLFKNCQKQLYELLGGKSNV